MSTTEATPRQIFSAGQTEQPTTTDPAVLYAQIRAEVEKEFGERFETWKSIELADLELKQDAQIRTLVQEYMDKFKAEQAPPSDEDIQKLLDQEYAQFTVPVNCGTTAEPHQKIFTIRELPMDVEQAFYRQFRDRMKDQAPAIAAFIQKNMDVPVDKQVFAFLNMFDSTFDMLADAVLLILNHDNSDPEVNREWIKAHMSSMRQWNIVKAAIKVNRLRDFFSQLFQAGTEATTMTTPLNYQQLQQLLRK